MKIILATGIYPPAIGGPATYVHALAEELTEKGNAVTVVTYGDKGQRTKDKGRQNLNSWNVVYVSRSIPVLRWFLYARALRKIGKDADAVIAFSSVSCGVPLWLARLKHPKKILRLGGDFFWERYTDRGGMINLKRWYETKPWSLFLMQRILQSFDHVVFSTRFQADLYEKFYRKLPAHSVIENALPSALAEKHQKHTPFKLLFMGRMVGFKNLEALMEATKRLDGVMLTMVGDGPMRSLLERNRGVRFVDSMHGAEKQKIFGEHDLLILPSITEISPNVALEARAAGLPVLLTRKTGLSPMLTRGMVVRDLVTPEEIMTAVTEVMENYERVAAEAATPPPERGWGKVAEEWLRIL